MDPVQENGQSYVDHDFVVAKGLVLVAKGLAVFNRPFLDVKG
jgi:hypothetical protein